MWLTLKVRENSSARYVYCIKHVAFPPLNKFSKNLLYLHTIYTTASYRASEIPSKYQRNDIKRLLHKKGKIRSELKNGPKTS